MRQLKYSFFILAAALTLSGCGVFGGSDAGTDVNVAEDVEAQPTVNSVQAVPASTPTVDPLAQPEGDGEAADAALPTAVSLPTAAPTPEPTVDRSQPTTYIVQRGDVLGLLAERFDVDIADLRRANNLSGNLIQVGQELTIPALDGSTETSDDSDSGESASGSSGSSGSSSGGSSSGGSSVTVSCSSGATGHCIQPGESLLGIALTYDVSVEALRAANPGISGDLIRSGEVLNLPGGSSPSTPVSTPVPGATVDPAATVGPRTDAECAAVNPAFPYYHDTDGLCYANPIGPTPVPTSSAAQDECPPGRFLWEDGLCYPIPGVTVTPTAGATPTSGALPDYGTAPCREGYLPLEGGRCWPEPDTTPATVVPVAVATATASAGTTTQCVEPNFFLNGTQCFLLPDGADAGCTLDGNVPKCP